MPRMRAAHIPGRRHTKRTRSMWIELVFLWIVLVVVLLFPYPWSSW